MLMQNGCKLKGRRETRLIRLMTCHSVHSVGEGVNILCIHFPLSTHTKLASPIWSYGWYRSFDNLLCIFHRLVILTAWEDLLCCLLICCHACLSDQLFWLACVETTDQTILERMSGYRSIGAALLEMSNLSTFSIFSKSNYQHLW